MISINYAVVLFDTTPLCLTRPLFVRLLTVTARKLHGFEISLDLHGRSIDFNEMFVWVI